MGGRRGGRFQRTTEGFPANGAAPRGWSLKATAVVGRVGRLRRGRCKYIHVSSVAASMRLTPLRSLPTRPLTVSGGVQPRRRKKKSKSAWLAALCRAEPTLGCLSIRFRIVDSDTDSSTHGVDLPCRPRSTPTKSCRNLSKAGHCGFAGCEPHGCGDQAPMDGFTAAPQTHSAPPSRRKPAVASAVAVASALASAGAGCNPAEPPPYGQAGGAAAQACCTSASDARSSSRHCGSSCP